MAPVHGEHGDHVAQFRERFWLSLALAVPVVVYSPMVQDWFGYHAPSFAGDGLVAPVLGTAVYLYGGWPFLTGAVGEARDRQPGMMLLIAMALTVALAASLATSLGLFDLDFWWELAALVVIMLLGHWMEMRALGQARGERGVLSVLRLSQAGYRKMAQNLAWAVGYNAVALPVAAGVAAPIALRIPPGLAAILMSVSTVVVVLNAQLLRGLDLRPWHAAA
jgi:Cu2+-exporting ATPase